MNTMIDTSHYLLLGTAAVFIPLLAYILSLVLRTRSARKQLLSRLPQGQPPVKTHHPGDR